ncbi:MAG: hypothetical protein JNL25_02125 [Rhodospirillaceae bacterium]|nr:hypothetical protein [Rhodospirillaceae bacterium]
MALTVTTWDDVTSALAALPDQDPIELWSPPAAAEVQGVLWFAALQRSLAAQFPTRRATIVLDCGDRADLAIDALRAGLASVALAANEDLGRKVGEIAAQFGGRLYLRAPESAPLH